MITRFIKWLNCYDEFKIETNIRMIFDDAIKCYNHNIPRPGLMLSYIAFMEAIRDKILISKKPDGYKPEEWENIQRKIQQARNWEEEVLNCIFREADPSKGKQAIFDVPNSIREDVRYWKNRRNDCAHYKANEISLAHLTAFWQFIMSNYTLFSPIGSIGEIVNEYDVHYDISQTPPNQDDRILYERLKLVLKSKDDVERFIKSLRNVPRDKQMEIVCRLSHESGLIKDYAIDFLKDKENITISYLRKFPDEIGYLYGSDGRMIRRLWYDETFAPIFFPSLLKQSLIPIGQSAESMKRYLNIWYNNKMFSCMPEDIDILLRNGIVTCFIDNYLNKSFFQTYYSVINFKYRFYLDIIKTFSLNDELIKAIDDAFSATNFPYRLHNELTGLFNAGILNKELYFASITKQGLSNSLNISRE